MYTYIPSLMNLFPTFPQSDCSRSSQSTELSSLCYTATSHQLSILHSCVYVNPTLPICFTLPSHPMSIFYICILFLSCKQAHLYHLSINRFHKDALIYDIRFSLSDLVLPMTDSRSIHITTNDSAVDLSSSTRD